MHDETWSKSEKAVARRAFDAALDREYVALTDKVRRRANAIAEPHHIWAVHDFLTRTRKDIDQKYDYRYSQLVIVFARLIFDGWLSESDLAGLAEGSSRGLGVCWICGARSDPLFEGTMIDPLNSTTLMRSC